MSSTISWRNTVKNNFAIAAKDGTVSGDEVNQIVTAAATDGDVTKAEVEAMQEIVDSIEPASPHREAVESMLKTFKTLEPIEGYHARHDANDQAHAANVQQTTEARRGQIGAYQNLEISFYAGCTLADGPIRGVDLCDGDITEEMQHAAGNKKRERMNADPTSKEMMIAVSNTEEIVSRAADYLGPVGADATVKRMEFHTGHGAMMTVQAVREKYGDAKANELLALGKKDSDAVGVMTIGTSVVTEATLKSAPTNALGIDWASGAEIDLAACQVGNDPGFVRQFQRVFSGGKATVYAATFNIPANGVEASAQTSAAHYAEPAKR